MAAAMEVKQPEAQPKKKVIPPALRSMAASTRDMLSGLGNSVDLGYAPPIGGLAERRPVTGNVNNAPDESLFDHSIAPEAAQDMIEDMSVIMQGVEATQFMNEDDDFGLFDDPTSG